MKDSNFKIAFLDSGHGGLDILFHFRKARGEKGASDQLIYTADLAFMPYGDLSSDKIYERCFTLCSEIENKFQPDLFVIACNTATAHAIDNLRESFSTPFVGMEPYLNYINKSEARLEKGEVGALVTPSTFKAPRFKSLKEKRDPQNLVEVLAPAELASVIEVYIQGKDEEKLLASLNNLFDSHLPLGWKEVILGCTHYPIIQKHLETLLNARCISPAERVIEQIYRKLEQEAPSHSSGRLGDFSFEYLNTSQNTWRKATLSEFLPWYLI